MSWVLKSDRLPKAGDCIGHAVLGWNKRLQARLIDHWSNIETNDDYVAWHKLPDPPPLELIELGGWK